MSEEEKEKEITATKVRFNTIMDNIEGDDKAEKEKEKAAEENKSTITPTQLAVEDKGDKMEFKFTPEIKESKELDEMEKLQARMRRLEFENYQLKKCMEYNGLSVEQALGLPPKTKSTKTAAEMAMEGLAKSGITKVPHDTMLGDLLRMAHEKEDEEEGQSIVESEAEIEGTSSSSSIDSITGLKVEYIGSSEYANIRAITKAEFREIARENKRNGYWIETYVLPENYKILFVSPNYGVLSPEYKITINKKSRLLRDDDDLYIDTGEDNILQVPNEPYPMLELELEEPIKGEVVALKIAHGLGKPDRVWSHN